MIEEINEFVVGWVSFFRHAACKSHLDEMDHWLRRRLRCLRLKQCKRTKPMFDLLRRLGVPQHSAWMGAACGKGWWRSADTPAVKAGLSKTWLESMGLVNLFQRYVQLNS